MFGKKFLLIKYNQNWGEDRVFFHNDQEELTSLPAIWTSLFPEDPWKSVTNIKSFFRVPDLLELIQLIKKNNDINKELLEQGKSNEM